MSPPGHVFTSGAGSCVVSFQGLVAAGQSAIELDCAAWRAPKDFGVMPTYVVAAPVSARRLAATVAASA
jgi:hypothetical protein